MRGVAELSERHRKSGVDHVAGRDRDRHTRQHFLTHVGFGLNGKVAPSTPVASSTGTSRPKCCSKATSGRISQNGRRYSLLPGRLTLASVMRRFDVAALMGRFLPRLGPLFGAVFFLRGTLSTRPALVQGFHAKKHRLVDFHAPMGFQGGRSVTRLPARRRWPVGPSAMVRERASHADASSSWGLTPDPFQG